jgi:hypothetical protein
MKTLTAVLFGVLMATATPTDVVLEKAPAYLCSPRDKCQPPATLTCRYCAAPFNTKSAYVSTERNGQQWLFRGPAGEFVFQPFSLPKVAK